MIDITRRLIERQRRSNVEPYRPVQGRDRCSIQFGREESLLAQVLISELNVHRPKSPTREPT